MDLSINLETISVTVGNLIMIAPGAAKKVLAAQKDTRISTVHFTLDFLAEIGMLKVKADLLDYISHVYHPNNIGKRFEDRCRSFDLLFFPCYTFTVTSLAVIPPL